MAGGYIKLFRQSIESQVFQSEGLWKTWCWCLMKASYKEKWISVKTGKGTTEVHLMPGEFVFGRKSAARKLKTKESTIRNRIEKLKNMQNLDTQSTTHYTIIKVLNWSTYQGEENKKDSQKDNQRTTKGQPKDTNKKDKKEKKRLKEKKKVFGEFENVLLSEAEEVKLNTRFGERDAIEVIERLSTYMASSGTKYDSHYATMLNWKRKDTPKKQPTRPLIVY